MKEPHRDHQPEPAAPKQLEPSEIPTLPLPSTWRLIVGGVVILVFLYFMYRSYTPEEPPVDPAKTSLLHGTG